MNFKLPILAITLLASVQVAYAGLFDTDKSKLEFSFGLENSPTSVTRKGELSWDGIWHIENDPRPQLKFSTKPYYKYSRSELKTAQEHSTKIGLDVIKASYEIGQFTPYISAGLERQKVETSNSTGNSTSKNNLSSLGYGLTYSFGKKSGASLTLYRLDKFTNIFDNKKSDESGLKLSLDFCTLLERCKKK